MSLGSLTPVADHLWQSTVFAAAAGLLTLVLRKNCARVRHRVWLAACCKFLVPFSIFLALGSHLPRRTASQTTPSAIAVDQVIRPFAERSIFGGATSTPPAPSRLPDFLWSLWACGFFGIGIAWRVRWRRMRDAASVGTPLRLPTPVPAISC